jgi:RNA polymerase subunit RPABC4/transcription elongation factor Spt4
MAVLMYLNTCQECGEQLAPDDFDGLCSAHMNGPWHCKQCGRFVGENGHDCPKEPKR